MFSYRKRGTFLLPTDRGVSRRGAGAIPMVRRAGLGGALHKQAGLTIGLGIQMSLFAIYCFFEKVSFFFFYRKILLFSV